MKPYDHFRTTASEFGFTAGVCAVLPDVGVVMQRAPVPAVRRWGAVLHHDDRTVRALPEPLRTGWRAHMMQDLSTHPPGTYGTPEAASVPPGAVLAYSGGVDSFITWRLLGMPRGIYLSMGNAAEGRETHLVRQVARDFGSSLSVLGSYRTTELSSGWVPYRNLRIILACAQESPDVVIARIAEWAPDKNPRFFRQTTRLLRSSRGGRFQNASGVKPVRIHTPVAHLTKTRLVKRYLQVFGPGAVNDLTDFTWSCYSPGPRFCGRCTACWSRWVAFCNNGIDERGRYEVLPVKSDFTSRLNWRDFRLSMTPVYARRAREMRMFP